MSIKLRVNKFTADEDIKLVSFSQKGDPSAFELLVKKYEKKMLNISYRMLGNYEDACDVVQDSFIMAYKKINEFKGESNFLTWLTKIVVNHTKNRIKKIQITRRTEPFSLDNPTGANSENSRIEPSGNDPLPDETVEMNEVRNGIYFCLKSLNLHLKEIAVLRDIQGYTYEEISAILKISDGTVKSRIARARTLLKECLKKRISWN